MRAFVGSLCIVSAAVGGCAVDEAPSRGKPSFETSLGEQTGAALRVGIILSIHDGDAANTYLQVGVEDAAGALVESATVAGFFDEEPFAGVAVHGGYSTSRSMAPHVIRFSVTTPEGSRTGIVLAPVYTPLVHAPISQPNTSTTIFWNPLPESAAQVNVFVSRPGNVDAQVSGPDSGVMLIPDTVFLIPGRYDLHLSRRLGVKNGVVEASIETISSDSLTL